MIIERGRNIPRRQQQKRRQVAPVLGTGTALSLLDCCRTSTWSHPRHRTGNAWSKATQATIQAESGRMPLNLVFKRLHLIFETQFQLF